MDRFDLLSKKPRVENNPNKFKVGDLVCFAPYYFELDVSQEEVHVVRVAEKTEHESTSGLWVQLDKDTVVIDAYWLVKAPLWKRIIHRLKWTKK